MVQWNLLLEEVTPITTRSPIMQVISRDDMNERDLMLYMQVGQGGFSVEVN